MKRNLYSIFLLPSFIIIFVLFYIQIGLAFGFVSKNIGEGGLFFAVIFFILMLLQAILLIPAYLSYKKIEDINEKQKIKNITAKNKPPSPIFLLTNPNANPI